VREGLKPYLGKGSLRMVGIIIVFIPGLAFAAHEEYDRDEGKDGFP
jgi:hypothetical protein